MQSPGEIKDKVRINLAKSAPNSARTVVGFACRKLTSFQTEVVVIPTKKKENGELLPFVKTTRLSTSSGTLSPLPLSPNGKIRSEIN